MLSNDVTQAINSLTQIRETLNFKMRSNCQDEYLVSTCNAIDLAIQNLNEYKQNRFTLQRVCSKIAIYLPLINVINMLVNFSIKILEKLYFLYFTGLSNTKALD